MKWLIGKLILRPLTMRNYRLRYWGELPDEWYWADALMVKWELWDMYPIDIFDGRGLNHGGVKDGS